MFLTDFGHRCLTMGMLDVTRLAMLRELSLRGTIGAAAQAMGYTPSAISQQLSVLEREAGVPLTVRSGRRLALTPAGERLARHAEKVLAALEAAEAAVRLDTGDIEGTVRVAVFQSAALALVPEAMHHLGSAHPGIVVKLTQAEPASALADIWARDADLVIAEEYPQHSAPHVEGIVRSDLLRDEIRLCALGAWSDAERLADLADAPWVMEPEGTATRHFAEQACRVAGFEPDVRIVSPDLQVHALYIEQGLAVGLLPGLMWQDGSLSAHARPLDPPAWRTVFTAVRAAAMEDRALMCVREALEAAAASHAVHGTPGRRPAVGL